MKEEALDLKHHEMLSQRLKKIGIALSEYCFANLFLFRNKHSYTVIEGKGVYVRGVTRDGHTFIMVTEPLNKVNVDELLTLLSDVDFLYPIPKSWKVYFNPDVFDMTSWDGDTDYVYTMHKMQYYPGRKLSGKRNLVKQFLEAYQTECFPISQERIPAALLILNEWKKSLEDDLEADYESCLEAFSLLPQITELEGMIYYIDKNPVGFILGEPLTSRTFVIHFMKALKEYKGIYQYIYQAFAQHLDGRYAFLNLEQDLGKPYLAQAKHSYVPDCLCVKLRVALNSNSRDEIKSGKSNIKVPFLSDVPQHKEKECENCPE